MSTSEEEKRSCSCTKNAVCQTTVAQADQTSKNYIGLTSCEFKARLAVHTQSFKDEELNQTSLSKHIHNLKKNNIDYTVTWKLVDRAQPFSPISGTCALCIKEKFYIMFRPTQAELNSRSEIYANCRHKRSKLLIPPPPPKKKKRKRKFG